MPVPLSLWLDGKEGPNVELYRTKVPISQRTVLTTLNVHSLKHGDLLFVGAQNARNVVCLVFLDLFLTKRGWVLDLVSPGSAAAPPLNVQTRMRTLIELAEKGLLSADFTFAKELQERVGHLVSDEVYPSTEYLREFGDETPVESDYRPHP